MIDPDPEVRTSASNQTTPYATPSTSPNPNVTTRRHRRSRPTNENQRSAPPTGNPDSLSLHRVQDTQEQGTTASAPTSTGPPNDQTETQVNNTSQNDQTPSTSQTNPQPQDQASNASDQPQLQHALQNEEDLLHLLQETLESQSSTNPSATSTQSSESESEEETEIVIMATPAIERMLEKYHYHESDSEDEEIDVSTMSNSDMMKILRGRKKRQKEAEWQNCIAALALHNKEQDKPIFTGSKDSKPEPHILMVEDWKTKQKITETQLVKKFKDTLEGQARIWYEELDKTGMTWKKLQQEFIREYSKGGKSDFQIKLEQNTLQFDPTKDKIRDFIRDFKSTATILNHSEEEMMKALCETLPNDVYYIASTLPTWKKLKEFLVNTYTRKQRNVATVSDATVSPFMVLQSENMQNQTQDRDRPPQNKPYKPWITPSRRGRPGYNSYRDRNQGFRPRSMDRGRYNGNQRFQPQHRSPWRNQRNNNWRDNRFRSNSWRGNSFRDGNWRGRSSYRNMSRDRGQSRSYSRESYRSMSSDRYNPRTTRRFISPKPPKQSYRATDTARQKSIDETRCFKCNEPGHWQRECPLNGQQQRNGPRRQSQPSTDRKSVSFRFGETDYAYEYSDISSDESDQEN